MEEKMQAIRLFAQSYRVSLLAQIDRQNNFQRYQYGRDIGRQEEPDKAQEYSKTL